MISVILPTHKKQPFLSTTILSVLSQSSDVFELIVVDASPDHYFENEFKHMMTEDRLLHKYENRIDKVKIICPEKGTHLPGKMKMDGFRHCVQDNDFCVFLDHDDFLYADLFKNIYYASNMFPNTEMIGTDYTSMMYNNGNIYTNKKTYMGGSPCGSIETIFIDNRYFKFQEKQDIYRNEHPYKSTLKPIIVSKNVIRENRFSFIEDTETRDDAAFQVMSHSLIETYICNIGYVYVGCHGSNSTIGRPMSEYAKYVLECCDKYDEMLSSVNYRKHRNSIKM